MNHYTGMVCNENIHSPLTPVHADIRGEANKLEAITVYAFSSAKATSP